MGPACDGDERAGIRSIWWTHRVAAILTERRALCCRARLHLPARFASDEPPLQPPHAPRRHPPQPHRRVADVPVLRPTTAAERLASRAPRQPRGRRRRARRGRGRGGHADGRITPGDSGIWSDAHVERAGARSRPSSARRAPCPGSSSRTPAARPNCDPPWKGGAAGARRDGGWQTVGPERDPVRRRYPVPRAMSAGDIERSSSRFARRRPRARGRLRGRRDSRRPRLPAARVPVAALEPAHRRVRRHARQPHALAAARGRRRCARRGPSDLPLFVRISATDWAEGGWDVEQSVALRAAAEGARRRPDRRARAAASARDPKIVARPRLPGAVRRARSGARPASRPARSE